MSLCLVLFTLLLSTASAQEAAAIEAQRQLAAMVSDPAAQALWTNNINATEAASGVTIPVPRDRINFGARLSWPVSDFFFAILPSVDAAEAGQRVREHEQAATEAGVRRSRGTPL